MSQFVKNDNVSIFPDGEATIISDSPLGSGGQGEVYLVEYKGNKYALKWYTNTSILSNEAFYNNLKENSKVEAPDSNFIWPLYITERVGKGGFGYIMDLIPKNKHSMSDILRTYRLDIQGKTAVRVPVGFHDLDTMVDSAIEIVEAFRSLHRRGQSYQDLNDGGIFFDTDTGEVLICDCDNVAPYGMNYGIGGKPGYMAPEVVTHESLPSADTDKFSLAVILFKLFIRGDPLEGAKMCGAGVMVGHNELKHYGTDPVFVYDPNNDTNRPVKGIHNNVIRMWPLYPDFLRQAFTKVFTDGLKNPSARLSDNEWFKILLKLKASIFKCKCKASKRFLVDSTITSYSCPKCNTTYPVYTITNGREKYGVIFGNNTKLMPFETDPIDYENHSVISAEMVESAKNPGVVGLRNCSSAEWTVTMPDGTIKQIPPGKAAVFVDGMQVAFSQTLGKATMKKKE